MKANTWLNHKACETEEEAEQFAESLIGGGIIQLQDDGKWHVFSFREYQEKIAAGVI